MFQEDDIIK